MNERGIDVNLKTNLVEVQSDKNIAIFANVENPSERKSFEVFLVFFRIEFFICTFLKHICPFQYSILHAVPPQGVPSVLLDKSSGLSNAAGFVDVNSSTLQHVKYSNVFALGDCSSTPNSKTMAAIGNLSWILVWVSLHFYLIFRIHFLLHI